MTIAEALCSDQWTDGEKFILEWKAGTMGHFRTALAETICRADLSNLSRLHKAFPEEVDAFKAWAHGDLGGRFREAGIQI